jgi:hypothetical protein
LGQKSVYRKAKIDFPPEAAENLRIDLNRYYALAELASLVRRLIFLAALRL